MAKRIDLIIITGFLGSGKTTLLNNIVSSYSDRSIGLLVNDFGEIPVDGSLIKDRSSDIHNNTIYEINNGSIFCSCLRAPFILGLQYFIREVPEVLFIETSGISDPSNMKRLLTEYHLHDAYSIKHILCVVDVTNVIKLRKNMTFVDKQIQAANIILLNKSDLIEDEVKKDISALIQGVNGTAHVEFTTFCDFSFASINPKPPGLENDADSGRANSIKSMILPQHDISDTLLLSFLSSLCNKILRLKGYYSFNGKEYYISNNNGRVEMNEIDSKMNHRQGVTLIYENIYHDDILQRWHRFKDDHSL